MTNTGFKIISSRKMHTNTSWQIISEWEDEFSKATKIPVQQLTSSEKSLIQKFFFHKTIFPFIPKFHQASYSLFYLMVAPYEYSFFSLPECIPIIIDAWKPDLERIEKFCKFNKFVFLGSLEAVLELNAKGMRNVFYSPVSISKKYECIDYPEKDIDLIVYGRNHEIMWDWVERLSDSDLHIVTCYPDKEKKFFANSNKKGVIGEVNKREDLMLLIKKSRYSAVSSTGNDKRNKANYTFTGGFSPVTPRFLECTVNYCQGVGIWYENPDFKHFEIDSIAIKTETFDQFEETINKKPDPLCLKTRFDAYLEQHWSYKRIEEIIRIVNG